MADTQKKSRWQRLQERVEASAQRAEERAASWEAKAGARFEGASLSGRGVTYRGTTVPLPATARVETAGEVRRRVTATRLVAGGGIGGLLFKKKVDDRELYLTVEGEGRSFVMDVDPKKGKQAREFAARVNSAR